MTHVLEDFSAPALIQAIEENLYASWKEFGRLEGGEFHDEPDLLWVAGPVPLTPYNVVLRTVWDRDIDRRIASVLEVFAARHTEPAWIISPSTRPTDLDRYLTAHGFAHFESLTGMAADLDQLPPIPDTPGVTIREADSAGDLRLYGELMAWRWHAPEATIDRIHKMNSDYGYGSDKPGRRWLAFLDERLVGKAFLYLGAGTAGIYGVGTLPEARNRSIGSALTIAAYHAAREAGYRIGVLHSTPMAVNLYRRLGFREYCTLAIFAPTRSLQI